MALKSVTTEACTSSFWEDEHDAQGIPLRMLCPISRDIMLDPVVASDGYTYDAPMLRRLLEAEGRAVSPMTRERLQPHYVANGTLQREIWAMLERYEHLKPALTDEQILAAQVGMAHGIARHTAEAAVLASSLGPHTSVDEHMTETLLRLTPARRLEGLISPPALRQARLQQPNAARPQPYASGALQGPLQITPTSADVLLGAHLRPYGMVLQRGTFGLPPRNTYLRAQHWMQDAPLWLMMAAVRAGVQINSETTQPLLQDPSSPPLIDLSDIGPHPLDMQPDDVWEGAGSASGDAARTTPAMPLRPPPEAPDEEAARERDDTQLGAGLLGGPASPAA